jgi:hypothetical protein
MLEVVAFKGFSDLAKATLKIAPPPKVCQTKHLKLEISSEIVNVLQIDGEVFPLKGPGVLEVKFKSQIKFLKYN